MSVSNKTIEKINEIIVANLEKGIQPWRKDWSGITLNDGTTIEEPCNIVTKTIYRGINRWILGCHPSALPIFLTFKQIVGLNGMVKKGATALPVIFFKKTQFEVETEQNNEVVTETKNSFILKYYNVFNITDTNLDVSKFLEINANPKNLPIDSVQPIIDTYLQRENIPLKKSNDRNYYIPTLDSIHMVPMSNFTTSNHYYTTLLHEIVHSTGHPKRLDRFNKINDKKKDYAFEELVAETAASYLAAEFQISNEEIIDNSSNYIGSWLKALQNDKFFFYQAAKKAEIASNYIIQEKAA